MKQVELQTAETLAEEWDSYLCRVNDKAASIFVNLALKDIAPDLSRPTLLIVWLYLQYPNAENGLSTQQEFDALCGIEDTLLPQVTKTFSAIYAGRITNDGRREFYFYSNAGDDFEKVVTKALADYKQYKFDAWAVANAEWAQYLNVLFPSAVNLRWMGDRKVVDQLELHGDSLITPREIEHWAYFSSEQDRAAFAASVTSCGFNIQNEHHSESSRNEFGLMFTKLQEAKLTSVYETTSFLEVEAEKYKGVYDGWGSPIIAKKNKSSRWKFWKKST
jgi:uncharacterized protein (TIGR01619 family)